MAPVIFKILNAKLRSLSDLFYKKNLTLVFISPAFFIIKLSKASVSFYIINQIKHKFIGIFVVIIKKLKAFESALLYSFHLKYFTTLFTKFTKTMIQFSNLLFSFSLSLFSN